MSIRLGFRPIMVCSAVIAFSHLAAAQTKVAIVNLQQAVFETAEIKKADAEMQAKYKDRAALLAKTQQEYTDLAQKYQAGQGKMTDAAYSELGAQAQRKQREAQRLEEDLNNDTNRDRDEILSNSTKKMSDVIKKLAEAKGFDMVVDTSTTLYFKPAMEITKDATAEYDKAYPATVPAKPAGK